MIDILTVVFRDELPVLKLQAESINLYCRDLGIQNIIIIVNDDINDDSIDTECYGNFSRCVKIINRKTLINTWHENGWVSQQVLKIKGSTVSNNQWTLILDAKTIFIRPLKIKNIFSEDQKIITGLNDINPVWNNAVLNVNNLFDVNLTQFPGPEGPPFLFNNKYIAEMIDLVETLTQKPFDVWFQEFPVSHMTEFILYSGYLQHQFKNLNVQYTNSTEKYRALNICHTEKEKFDSLLNGVEIYDPHTIAVHRVTWNYITQPQKERYKNFLINRGITSAKDL